jgi:RNA polymerase sigma factor (sigma-70 family)
MLIVVTGTNDLPMTTSTLLDLLRTPGAGVGKNSAGETAWAEMDARYRPVLIGFADALGRLGGAGWSRADAEDAAQWTLAELARSLRGGEDGGGYARGRGRLRAWIMGIARNRVRMIRRSMSRRNARHVAEPARAEPDDAAAADLWDREQDRAVLERALTIVAGSVSAETMRIFELAVVRGMDANAVARECGVEVEKVYVTKTRVTRSIRETAKTLGERYDEDR